MKLYNSRFITINEIKAFIELFKLYKKLK